VRFPRFGSQESVRVNDGETECDRGTSGVRGAAERNWNGQTPVYAGAAKKHVSRNGRSDGAVPPENKERQSKMKAEVDRETCTGCELCPETCPQVFEMDGDTARVKVNTVPPEAENACRQAAEECPVEAITIQE